MKKLIAILLLSVVAVSAFAADAPKEIEVRYKTLVVALNNLDSKAFKTYFTEDYVSVDPKGKSTKLPEYLKEIDGLFKSGKSAKAVEKTLSTKMVGKNVAVNCDLLMTIATKEGGTTVVHEVCTDYWKKVKGQWRLYKTVDTVFDVKPGEHKNAKPGTGKVKK